MEPKRKTKKYYREMLTKDFWTASKVLSEVIDKYFSEAYTYYDIKYFPNSSKVESKTPYTYIDRKVFVEHNYEVWNCYIAGFYMPGYKKGAKNVSQKVTVSVTWLGDSTDGDIIISLEELMRNPEYIVPAEYGKHSTLRIKREWLFDTFNEIAKRLQK